MTEKDTTAPPIIAVGTRVRVALDSNDSRERENQRHPGMVIEDCADMAIDPDSVGRDWARIHRWTIALDDGRLSR